MLRALPRCARFLRLYGTCDRSWTRSTTYASSPNVHRCVSTEKCLTICLLPLGEQLSDCPTDAFSSSCLLFCFWYMVLSSRNSSSCTSENAVRLLNHARRGVGSRPRWRHRRWRLHFSPCRQGISWCAQVTCSRFRMACGGSLLVCVETGCPPTLLFFSLAKKTKRQPPVCATVSFHSGSWVADGRVIQSGLVCVWRCCSVAVKRHTAQLSGSSARLSLTS